MILVSAAPPATAQGRRLSFIRDAEIEHIIAGFAEPIFHAAGIDPRAVGIYLVSDPGANAFVTGGQNMFVTTGLLTQTTGPEQLIGVIAHETGHMAGGHLARGQDQMESARRTALVSALLGLAAAVAAGDAGAGAAVIGGGSTVAQRSFLSYSRTMEGSADQAGVTYLDQVGITSEGLLSFFEQLEDQELLPQSRQAEYVRTHPLTRDRIEFIREHVRTAETTGRPMPPATIEAYRRVQAKLIGFMQPQAALRRYATDQSVSGRYARSIAQFRLGNMQAAMPLIDDLIAEEPTNPFFHELRGQMLLENGQPAAARASYERANELFPGESTMMVPLAQIMLATEPDGQLEATIDLLKRSVATRRGSTPMAWRLLATAYGRSGDLGMAAVALAEEALARGDRATARAQADRAIQTLPEGSAGWLRAQDVRNAADGGRS